MIRCESCGASLRPPEGVRYVTCNYCDASLEVVRDSSTSHARMLEDLGERTGRVEKQLDEIRAREEIASLETAWRKYLASVSLKRGRKPPLPPSKEAASGYLIVGVFITVLACVLSGGVAWWLAGVAALLGFSMTWHLHRMERLRAEAFDQVRKRYEMRKRELESLL